MSHLPNMSLALNPGAAANKLVSQLRDQTSIRKIIGDPKAFTFLFARHPFERLVSAYESCVVQRLRLASPCYVETVDSMGPTFADYVRVLLSRKISTKECKIHAHWQPANSRYALVYVLGS